MNDAKATSKTTESSGTHSSIEAHTGGDVHTCPTCGQASDESVLEQFLGRLGISDEMLETLKTQFQNVEIDDYLTTARDYISSSGKNAQTYLKENPAKIAAGVAVLAFGAGLMWSRHLAAQRTEDQMRQQELTKALSGPKYRLDEVLRELDVPV